ncbi:MAG: hypothetical protein JO108_33240, partial [Acidobacteriaceae bacterium]|nr:hypothetical protein [Acidobacteriaceae bacterium]
MDTTGHENGRDTDTFYVAVSESKLSLLLEPSGPIGKLAGCLKLQAVAQRNVASIGKEIESTGRKVIVLRASFAHGEGGHRGSSIRSMCGSGRAQNQTRKETATFRTFTADLERLRKWLEEREVNQVALESTGVFWIPVWNILE